MKAEQRAQVFSEVYELVSQIPLGRVATYGDIAKIVGVNPRYVGYTLHHNPLPGKIPCHRVVNSEGRVATNFAFGGGKSQQQLLESEGVSFKADRLSLARYRYFF